jgi:hypothetical protein
LWRFASHIMLLTFIKFSRRDGWTTLPAAQLLSLSAWLLHSLCICHPCLQVTNRDLSVAVLRKFLPQLAQELADGTLKRKMKTAPPKHEAAANGAPARAKVQSLVRPAHTQLHALV